MVAMSVVSPFFNEEGGIAAAARGMVTSLRRELRDAESDIRVTAVSPGFVRTEFAEVYHRDPSAAERTYGRYPVLQPDDIAH